MRALLECAGCLAHGTPIPLSLLDTATSPAQRADIQLARQQLIQIGFLRQVDRENVQLTAAGYAFLASRPASARARDSVELALLMTANQLVAAGDRASMAALQPHLAVVVDAALLRADDKAAMLAATFLLCLLHLEAVESIREYLPRLQALEAASGYSILPAGLVERFTGKESEPVTLTQPMFAVLQSLACLDDSRPAPLSLFYALFEPRPEIEQVVAKLAGRGYVTRPDEESLLLTDAGKRLRQPVEPALREGVVSGLVKVVQAASDLGDTASLRRLQPHLQTMTEAALPQANEMAHRLLLTLIQCLVGLNELPQAAAYIDQAEELEAALGLAPAETPAVTKDEKAVQYHTQLAVHYFQRGEFGRARPHFEQALAITDDPALRPPLHQKIGDCCGELGDEAGKIAAYVAALEQALAYHGRDSWEVIPYRNDLVLLLIAYGELGAAARHLDESLRRAGRARVQLPRFFKETAKAHLLAADVAYRQGRQAQGQTSVERALAQTGKLGDHWLDRAHLLYMAASLFYRNGNLAAARPIAEQAWEIGQNHLERTDREAERIAELIADLHGRLS